MSHHADAASRPAQFGKQMLAAFAPQADNIQREAFAHTWHGWVYEILLEHADDAEFITLED